MTSSGGSVASSFVVVKENITTEYAEFAVVSHANAFTDVDPMMVVAYGELENE